MPCTKDEKQAADTDVCQTMVYGQTPSEIEIIQLQRHSYDNYILNH